MDAGKTEFDAGYETLRLEMLSRQFPEHADCCGEVRFVADDDEARLNHASWSTEGDWFVQAGESGFKLYLMELLDSLIQYRAQCGQSRWKRGIVRISQGAMSIDWLVDDESENG
jgi:hypothetical protein